MLLIFPPVAKPCEPPAGIAKLAGALSLHGVPFTILDGNLEGQLFLLNQPHKAIDTWSRRAVKNCSRNLDALRDARTYQSMDRYSRAVKDVNRVLELSADNSGIIIGLADYQDQRLSPVRSPDLIAAAEHPELNPFYPWFSNRLSEFLEKTCSLPGREGREGNHEDNSCDNRSKQIVGFSLNYLSQALCTFAMIGYIRKEFPDTTIVLGGGLVSSWLKRTGWKNPFGGLVDCWIAGPGEKPLLDLLGIQDAKQQYTPSYASLPLSDYLSPGVIFPYSGSSGCYWNKCSFCPETAEDNPYIPVPVQHSMNDLVVLTSLVKPVLIHLLDNAISPALMSALAEKPPGVPWYGFARIGKELADFDYCMALKRSGCVMLKLGLESGDQAVLDKLDKGIELEMASRVLRNLEKAGIATYVYLLFGTPAETIVEARKTLEFVIAHERSITCLNLAIFNMPVCGKEAGDHETEPFSDGDLSLYTGFKHPRGFDRKIVRRFIEQEFKRHPAVASILKQDPPVFTSNHAALFASRKVR